MQIAKLKLKPKGKAKANRQTQTQTVDGRKFVNVFLDSWGLEALRSHSHLLAVLHSLRTTLGLAFAYPTSTINQHSIQLRVRYRFRMSPVDSDARNTWLVSIRSYNIIPKGPTKIKSNIQILLNNNLSQFNHNTNPRTIAIEISWKMP